MVSKFERGNIGIATGTVSGIAVLDIDGPEGEAELAELLKQGAPLPDTRTVRTGRGRHLYFSIEAPLASRKVAPHIDLKADGGYVVAPPSLHASGRRYEWLNDAPLAPMPEWLYRAPEVSTEVEKPRLDPRSILSGVPEGERDWTIYRYSCRLRGKGFDLAEAVPLVLIAASNCEPPFPEAVALSKVEEAWKLPTNEAKRLAEQGSEDAFRLVPLDLAYELANPRPPVDWLVPDFLPAARRVWGFGSAESAKSMWALWVAAKLTREGRAMVYVSQENPLDEDLRRVEKLRPNLDLLRFFHAAELNLADPDHVLKLIDASQGAALVVLDTLSACWIGKEDDNAAIAALDRDALLPLVTETGAAVLILDHVGHPQAHVKRGGVNAGRGASAKGQKADVVLHFQARAPREFSIDVAKMRAGSGEKAPLSAFRIVDREDGAIDIEQLSEWAVMESANLELRDKVVVFLEAHPEGVNTTTLRETIGGNAGQLSEALNELVDAGRVTGVRAKRPDKRGHMRGQRIWRLK